MCHQAAYQTCGFAVPAVLDLVTNLTIKRRSKSQRIPRFVVYDLSVNVVKTAKNAQSRAFTGPAYL